MKIRLIGWVALLVALSACVAVDSFKGPNGRDAYSMQCGNDSGACYRRAGEVCPSGYDILNQQTGTAAVPVQGGIFAVPQYSLQIECK